MRHRRVISLYDEEKAHEELLIHLEGIAGQHRQGQALLQMCLIGFRVMAFQESGEQAYLSVRNPDLLQFGAKQRKPIARLPAGQEMPVRTYPPRTAMESAVVPEGSHHHQVAPESVQMPVKQDLEAVESYTVENPVVSLEKGTDSIAEPSLRAQTPQAVVESADEPAFEYEEYDTLKLLQQLGGE
jgi:hypothetical protein